MPVTDEALDSDRWRLMDPLSTAYVSASNNLIGLVEEDRRQKDMNRVNYLLRVDEVWSRAYAQWVATSSQDPILLQQLETLRHDCFIKYWCVDAGVDGVL